MNTSDQYSVILCPFCGSMDLEAVYDEHSDNFSIGNLFRRGLLGLIFSVARGSRQNAFWVCQNCGHQFPIQ
ncbi:hypothetical protein ACKQTC_06980 [Peptococcus simiae]|uniref:Uncharacterized protein n=1 Tax=Peptococcus simiae TaxID=1643805 RepID=A0ABW9H0N9_9FIRM